MLVVTCLSVHIFILPVCGFLTCKYINQPDSVAVYIRNTRSTLYSFFLTAAYVPLIFHAVVWPSRQQPYLCSNFESSKYVRQYLFCCLFRLKQVIFAGCGILIYNCFSGVYLVDLSSRKTQLHVPCLDFNHSVIHSRLILSY